MIERHDLCASVVSRPGERLRMRVQAGPGWIEGEHGQDLAEGLRHVTAVHGGEWSEVSRAPGAQVARCTAKACSWATRPIKHGRRAPTTCEACGAPAALAAVPEAGEVIVLEQVAAPTRAQRLERDFRAAKPQRRVAAARAWAQALLEERGAAPGAGHALLATLADRAQRRAQPAELEQLVRRGVELACPARAQHAQDTTPAKTRKVKPRKAKRV